MKNTDIIDFIFYKKQQDNLFLLEDSELSRLSLKADFTYDEILKFIDLKVHPKCRKTLKKLLSQYIKTEVDYKNKENQLFYRYGYSDGTKNVLSATSIK